MIPSGESTVRRALRMLVRAALLGAITTIGLAWGLALWLPHRNLQKQFDSIWPERKGAWAMVWVREYRRAGMARRLWLVAAVDSGQSSGITSTFDQRLSDRGHTGRWEWRDWGTLARVVRETDPAVRSSGADDSRGWPWRAMWCEIEHAPLDRIGRFWDASGGVVVSGAADVDIAKLRVLPMRPLWAGLVGDWAVHGAAWLAGMLGTAWGVGAWRRRHRRCVRCGYSLVGGTAAGCPECGWNRPESVPA